MVRWYGGTLVRLSDKKSMSDICLLLYFSLILLAKMNEKNNGKSKTFYQVGRRHSMPEAPSLKWPS